LIGFSLGNNFEHLYAGVWAGLILLLSGVLFRRLRTAKSTAKFSQKEKILYQVFKGLQVDEFRGLLKITTWNTPTDHTTLTTEDRVCDNLFYVLQGKTEVSKGDKNIYPKPEHLSVSSVTSCAQRPTQLR
jgi:hypothetical protein